MSGLESPTYESDQLIEIVGRAIEHRAGNPDEQEQISEGIIDVLYAIPVSMERLEAVVYYHYRKLLKDLVQAPDNPSVVAQYNVVIYTLLQISESIILNAL